MHDLAQFFTIIRWLPSSKQAIVWNVLCVCIVIVAGFSYEFDTNECNSTKWCNFLGIVFSD